MEKILNIKNYQRLFFINLLYNFLVVRFKSNVVWRYFFYFISLFYQLRLYDNYDFFFKFFVLPTSSLFYPVLYFDKFLGVWTFSGLKEKFFSSWLNYSHYICWTFSVSPFVFSFFLMYQYFYPFILVPSRYGRKIFRIAQNMRLQRAFRLLGHRLKTTVINLREVSLLYKWFFFISYFMRSKGYRSANVFFLRDTLGQSKQNISRRHFRISI